MSYSNLIMLIEQTTTYAYKLKYLENPSFDKVRNLAKKFIDELPKELVDGLYSTINRGVDILKTEPEMLVYLYSLGNMHQAKLNFAFAKIPEDFLQQPEINIIDYGCGQAIGTMCYADFLKSKNYNQQIKSVTLIEPSEICLKRAALHVSVCCPNVNLSTVNKKFDELSDMDCSYKTDIPTLHILSNVLDLDFDLQKFAKIIYLNLRYYNQFVCVGPYFYSLKKDRRMNDFANLLRGNIDFSTKLGKGESTSNVYVPSGNFAITWDDNLKAYLYIGFYSDGMMVPDGYDNDNRPDGAKLVLNNGRGTITWNKTTKTWNRV